MPSYDSIYFVPPAPLAFVTLRNPANNLLQTDVPMLLDTGADTTLVPETFIKKLNVDFSLTEKYELAGFDNQKSVSHLIHLHLIFEGLTFRGDYFLINQDYGIIGRNILNLLNVNLDGRNGHWEIL